MYINVTKGRHRKLFFGIVGIVVGAMITFTGFARLKPSESSSLLRVLAADNIGNPGSGLPEQPPEPKECVNDEQQHSQDQGQTNNDQQRQANQQRHDQLVQQLNGLNQRMSDSSLSDADKQSIQSQMDSVRSEMTTLEKQSGNSSPAPHDSSPSQGTHEPSAACKAAIVHSAQSNLGQYKNIINNRILPTLDRVNTVSDTVEASIPHFREIGVPEATITQLQHDIATLRSSSTTLRGFFQNVIAKINAFLAKISDPNAAFDGMKNGFSVSDQDSATKAGENLVSAFTDLQKIISGIKE